jgi:hypothetical protein
MMDFSVPARLLSAPSSLLVSLLTQRAVLVSPSSGFPLGSPPFVPPLPVLACSLLLALRVRFFLSLALPASLSIGRGQPTR